MVERGARAFKQIQCLGILSCIAAVSATPHGQITTPASKFYFLWPLLSTRSEFIRARLAIFVYIAGEAGSRDDSVGGSGHQPAVQLFLFEF